MSTIMDFKAKNIKEECFAMVAPSGLEGEELNITIIGRQTEEKLANIFFNNATEFIDGIPSLFTSRFKAVILMLFQHATPEFRDNLHFCKAVKAALDSLLIPNYFITHLDYVSTSQLIELNYPLKLQETVLMVLVGPEHLSVDVFEYTVSGHKLVDKRMVFVDQETESPQIVRSKIFQSWNPKRIMLRFCDDKNVKEKKYYKTLLKSKKLVFVDRPTKYDVPKITVEMCKWLLDKSYIKYHTIPICAMYYHLGVKLDNGNYGLLFENNIDQPLPCKKEIMVRKVYGRNLFFSNGFDRIQFSQYHLDQKCHLHKLTISIDTESFPTIEHEPVISSSIISLPEKLNKSGSNAAFPIIGLYESCSVICVNKNGKYQFLDAWNGQYGKDLAIAFDDEKPKFCEAALQSLADKPSFVVYDLLNIMSMPSDAITVDEVWSFKVTKDAENPVLLEFDNYNGNRKAASPAFLMALILKEHLTVIKAEIGEKFKVLGFVLYDNFNVDEKKRAVQQLHEACELLKIECAFVC